MGIAIEKMRAAYGRCTYLERSMSFLSGYFMLNAPKHQVVKFWLLLSGGVLTFAAWLFVFARCANIWRSKSNRYNTIYAFSTYGTNHSAIYSADNDNSVLLYVDIWFALALMAAIDAFAIVLNFNRSLIHQFHFFVSLRMMSLAFIISTGLLLVYGGQHNGISRHPATVFFLCCLLYAVFFIIFQQLHKLLPVRGIGTTPGSLQSFSDQMCCFDLPWRRTLLFATINGGVGLALTALVPAKWSMLNPVLHITWEVTFLGLMATKQTPRYIWFATPVVQASTCTDWGLRQVIAAPSLVMAPWAFLAVMVGGRLLLDLHLQTVLRHRHDFLWARNKVLFSTRNLLLVSTAMLLLEDLGLPVVMFIKPIAVVLLHTFGVLVFLLPASYALGFDKIKTIRK